MKKIILFIDSLASGGAQRQILTLAKELSAKDYNVRLLLYYDINHYQEFIKDDDLPIDGVFKKNKYDISFYFRIYQYFKKNSDSCYIAYLNTPSNILRVLGRLAKVDRVVTSERNIDLVHSKLRSFLERFLYRLSDVIVVNAMSIESMMVDMGVPASKIKCIYNGVDTNYFSNRKNGVDELRSRFGVNSFDRLIILPGRLSQQKNPMCLLKAAVKLNQKYKNIKVMYLGNEFDQGLKKQLLKYAEENNYSENVIYAGYQSDMPLFYSAADIIALPSLWEGLPNAVIESMACQKIVVASDVADNSKIIQHSVNGYIVKVDDSGDLAEKLNTALNLNDKSKADIELNARKSIINLCGLENFVNQYELLIR